MRLTRRKRQQRRGATVIETAFALPVLFLFVWGLAEFCNARMTVNMLKTAARTSARYASTEGVSTAACESRFRDIVGAAMDETQVSVVVKDGSVFDNGDSLPATAADYASLPDIDLAAATPRQLFIVRASVAYNDVALIGLPWTYNLTLTGQAISRHE